MKILAVYGTEYGQAEAVVRRLATALGAAGHSVSILRADDVQNSTNVVDFDAVLVGASIIMGKYQRSVRDFVRRHRDVLNRLPSAFVSVSGASPESVPEWQAAARGYVAKFLEETSWSPRRTATFAGALRYTRYGIVTRWIMKRISAKSGGPTDTSRDYEFTDWAAVDRFGSEFARSLAAEYASVA